MNKKGDKGKMPPPEEVDTITNKHGDKNGGKSVDKRVGAETYQTRRETKRRDKEDKHKKGET